MSTISTKEIYAQVAEKAGKSQATVKATIDALLETIAENVS